MVNDMSTFISNNKDRLLNLTKRLNRANDKAKTQCINLNKKISLKQNNNRSTKIGK